MRQKKLARFFRWCLLTGQSLALTFVCTACHGSGQMKPFSMPEVFDDSKQYEITFWAKNDSNIHQTKIYEQAIEDFQKIYPNIQVNLRLYSDYGTIYNDVITNISTGTTPNVCITYPDHIATYLEGQEVMVELDDLLTDPVYGLGGSAVRFPAPKKEQVVGKFLEECKINGHYYALPYMRSTEVCYLNRTYLEQLGFTVPEVLTWDFVWEVSEAAMKKGPDGKFLVNGQEVMIPFIYKSTDNMMISMLRQKEAGYAKDDGEIQIFNDTTGELLETIAKHGESRAFSTFKITGYPANFLNAGQCIFAVDSTAGSTWMGDGAPLSDISEDKLVRFDTAVRFIPQFDPEHPQMISQGPSVCVFNKGNPQEVLASWLFTQYLLSNDVQIPYAETEGYIPVTQMAQEDKAYKQYLADEGKDNDVHYAVKIIASKLLLDNIDRTFTAPVYNGSASLRDAACQLVESTVKSVRRGQQVDGEYIKKLYEDVTALYRLDQRADTPMGRKDMGPLPMEAKILLGSIATAWILLILYFSRQKRTQ